ncbi:MAG TPA: hypothetical protein VK616_01105 [Flavitalea sp.]|nr:hypothetical protein [Flavitalea sp.]
MKESKSYSGIWSFLTVIFVSLSLFSYGTAMMDYVLIHPSRLIIGENEFVGYHALLEERILPVSVVPFAVIMIIYHIMKCCDTYLNKSVN